MEFKQTDIKLLNYLYHNNREPFSKIAKACNLTREQVEYRINKYVTEGIIKKFATVFNYSAFNHNCLVILFVKFEKSKSINLFLKKEDKNCISKGESFGKYEIYLNLIFKDEDEFQGYLFNLNEKNAIKDYLIIKPSHVELYPLKLIDNYKTESYQLVNQNIKEKLDKNDLLILKSLEESGRMKLIEISKKVNLSPELTFYKLKQLFNKKVILGQRIDFNMKNLGYFYSLILINLKKFTKLNQDKIRNFCHNSKYINSLILSLNKPNCIIQVFHKTEDEYRDAIEKIKNLLKDDLIDLDLLLINEEETINTLPFL